MIKAINAYGKNIRFPLFFLIMSKDSLISGRFGHLTQGCSLVIVRSNGAPALLKIKEHTAERRRFFVVRSLTEGSAWRHIVALAIPLLLGNVFQASYNLVDTMIVGRYVGPEALAGVGIASPVFNLINALLIGLSVGSSIVVSQLFGARQEASLPRAVSTVLWTSLGLALILTAAGQLLTDPFLRVLQTPAEDYIYAEIYLRTILCGLICNVFYNQLTGLLRGLGNTKTALYILIFSCCANATLDLVFICGFHLGVMGAGLATIIAEGASAVLTALYIKKYVPQLHTRGSRAFDRAMFSTVVRFGLPMGLQQASISFGHVLMQGIVNPFGTSLIAGYAAASKVDMFAVMPIISLGSAMSTFAAQNAGAGKYDRVRTGYRTGCAMTVVICIALACAVTPLRMFWMSLFVSAEEYPELAGEIIAMGAGMLAVTPLFYWVLGLIHAALNTMAGAGDTLFSMIAMIVMMLLRVVLAWALIALGGMDQTGIWWAFVLSWFITLAMTMIHYFRGSWKKKALDTSA